MPQHGRRDGLSDFKLKLADSVNEGVHLIHRRVSAGDKSGDMRDKVIDNTVATRLKHCNEASAHAIERACEALAAAAQAGRRIEFDGVSN